MMTMDERTQRMRLIVNGAVSLYEGQGLGIASMLDEQGRSDLLTVLDALMTALYWLQAELNANGE